MSLTPPSCIYWQMETSDGFSIHWRPVQRKDWSVDDVFLVKPVPLGLLRHCPPPSDRCAALVRLQDGRILVSQTAGSDRTVNDLLAIQLSPPTDEDPQTK